MSKAESLPLEFARYIVDRMPLGTPWPEVYDEMCRVARSRAFRGMGYQELADAGISLSIIGLERVCQLLEQAWAGSENAPGAQPRLA